MSLNIKNPETYELAHKIAYMTGESLTSSVTIALRERLARLTPKRDLASELLNIGKDCASRMREPYKSIDHDALLYDDMGLPK